MAAPALPPAAATSLIEKLPAELLEKILLEAVDPVTSPTIHGEDDREAWQRKLMVRKCITVYALQVRLVCHNFRDLAWRAFGKVVGETISDLASRQSFDALQAIVKVRYVNDEDVPNITEESLDELVEVRYSGHFAVVNANLQQQNNKLLLEHYGANLHCLDLVNINPRGLDNVFDTIKAMNLGILNVRQSSGRYWRNEADSPDDWSEWHRGGKYTSLAKEVFLQPPSFQV